jgi:hypothetical protein
MYLKVYSQSMCPIYIESQTSKLRLVIVQKQMDDKIQYMEKHCLLNNSLYCKKKWKEISALHKLSEKLSENEE